MSNSALVAYTNISPNKTSPRTKPIDTVTIHCVVGQCTVESLGSLFAKTSRQASSNYGIGYDGKIGMYVEEKDRSWCSSSATNDHRAITIEVASDTTKPYAVTEKAYAALLDLVTDICRRNGIKKLVWSANKNDRVNHLNGCNMTVHRDFAATSCPGTYLYERQGQIAAEVNKRLSGEDTPADQGKTEQNKKGDYTVEMRLLKNGCNGEDVRALQILLIGRGYSCGSCGADGIFGSGTDSAVRVYQKAKGLAVDGIAGHDTMTSLLGG